MKKSTTSITLTLLGPALLAAAATTGCRSSRPCDPAVEVCAPCNPQIESCYRSGGGVYVHYISTGGWGGGRSYSYRSSGGRSTSFGGTSRGGFGGSHGFFGG